MRLTGLLARLAIRITTSVISARFAVVAAGTASIIAASIFSASIIPSSVITTRTIARSTAIASTGIVIVVFAIVLAIVLVPIFNIFPVPFESGVVGIEIFLSRKQIICQRLVNLYSLTSAISNSDDISTIRSNLAIGAPNYVDFVTGFAGIDNPLGIGIEMAIDFKANPRQTNPLLQTLRVLLKFLVKLTNLRVNSRRPRCLETCYSFSTT